MYLLFEWVEDRDGKIHYGIYSTLEKAQAAGAASAAESEEGTVEWEQDGTNGWMGIKSKAYDQDYPLEITAFELDA